MVTMKVQLEYESGKILKRAVGINLEPLPITNKRAKAKNLTVMKIYYFTSHFVAREDGTAYTCILIPPPGHRIRFPGFPKNQPSRIEWKAVKAYTDYFPRRKFYIEVAP